MVQNLIIFRFANTFLEPLLNSNYVKSVRITFKEDFGTMGRGGYFDQYGVIRDVMQNHLMQVLTLVAMEPPVTVAGDNFARHVSIILFLITIISLLICNMFQLLNRYAMLK